MNTAAASAPRVEDLFCFDVYRTAHQINRAYRPLLEPLGLTYPQYIVLVLLWETDQRKVTELALSLQMGTNTLTPLIKRLEVLGHVTRRRSKADGRAVIVTLTKQGRALQTHCLDITSCMIDNTGCSQQELVGLQKILSKLNDNLGTRHDAALGS